MPGRAATLFLAHRLPFPPDRGDKIRSHHMLKALAALGPVHVGCFAESAGDFAHEGDLATLATSHCLPLRRKPLALAGAEALVRGVPVSLSAFRSDALATWVEQVLRAGDVETIYVFSGQMGQYVPRWWTGRLVVDLVDVDSAKFEQYAADGTGPMRWVNAREARLLKEVEAVLAARADATLLVSEAEAALLRSRLPQGSPARVLALGNGIDFAAFDPAAIIPEPGMGQGPHILFTGQMDYPPNVDAVARAARSIMPLIRKHHPQAQLHVVGRAPVAQVQALDGVNGTRVWGEVPDVRPFLAGADMMLAPLVLARGVQNKVLEAMAMALPAVVSVQAATGIDAQPGEHLLVGDTDADLADHACALLADPARARAIGHAARRFVTERMGWPAMLAPLPALVGHEGALADAA